MRRILSGWIGTVLILLLSTLAMHSQSVTLVAKFVNQELSLDSADPIWTQASRVQVPLVAQQIAPPFGGGSVTELNVRALHNGRMIAFLMEWADATKDSEVAQVDKFGDAVALEFPAEFGKSSNPLMGDAQGAVNIWQWQAAWQRDIDEGGLADVDRVYPPYASTVPYGVTVGKDAGNWRSQRTRTTPIENLIAQGYGTLTHQEQQDVLGRGVWKDGQWKVVFLRTLQSGVPGDAPFMPGQKNSVNFAVWEGANQDRGSRKSVTLAWQGLQLEEPATSVTLPPPTMPPIPSTPEKVRVVEGVPTWMAILLGGLGLFFGGLVGWLLRWMISPRV